MMLYVITAAMVAIEAFVLGWLMGFRKSTYAHGWNVPKINQKNDTDRSPRQ
jgi:hypothetical protein